MFKKFLTYPVFLIIFLSFVGSILLAGLVKYNYDGGKKFKLLRNTAMFIANIPINVQLMIKYKAINIDKPEIKIKHYKKKKFEQFINNKRYGLLIIPRYDYELGRSIVDVVDLSNFKIIHTYKHNIGKMNSQVQNIKLHSRLNIDHSPTKFVYYHPLILNDGSLIGTGDYSPIFKIDFCSNLEWINDKERFHHSIMLNHEKDIWIGGQFEPHSKFVKKFQLENFSDDSIVKINNDGEILFKKSVLEILIENKILPTNYALNTMISNNPDPMHLNDIEPVFYDSPHWKKGDLFLSIRHKSAIIHYRPSNNKVINYITGPFSQQHDVDIISEKEISSVNNNNFSTNTEYSEVLIYNFETKKFTKYFDTEIQNEKFKTLTGGLSQILNDGSLMIEESDHGRLILFNNKGQKEWEFINKDINGDISVLSWARIVENELFIENYKSIIEKKKCTN